jgi:hypothetical protein
MAKKKTAAKAKSETEVVNATFGEVFGTYGIGLTFLGWTTVAGKPSRITIYVHDTEELDQIIEACQNAQEDPCDDEEEDEDDE